jgi:hypothetical protein
VSTFPGHALRQPLLATTMLNRDRGNNGSISKSLMAKG